ncbi:hypothetical protein EVC30_096 [Rhizobium phage RHph_Y1_11]|nr:hypothetical protein EVC30_096 [Rhizobium phage RHph_Y1_11]
MEKHHALAAPCKSCPYRKDVPSGIWAASEYEKLHQYDGEIIEQLHKGGMALFECHQLNGALCSGWLGCHGPHNLLAMRLHAGSVAPETFDYETDVPLFASGAEAAAHGMRDIEISSEAAHKTMARILKKRARKHGKEG